MGFVIEMKNEAIMSFNIKNVEEILLTKLNNIANVVCRYHLNDDTISYTCLEKYDMESKIFVSLNCVIRIEDDECRVILVGAGKNGHLADLFMRPDKEFALEAEKLLLENGFVRTSSFE